MATALKVILKTNMAVELADANVSIMLYYRVPVVISALFMQPWSCIGLLCGILLECIGGNRVGAMMQLDWY